MINQTVSHYKILEKLGEGGMGVVYKADDLKLKRTVALKFLPHHLTANSTEQARFLQEAQAASGLNHPHVCTIYDIAEEGGQQFIVMEYVDGETLRQRIASLASQGNAPMDLKDAVNYAVQIGEALQEAHGKGIVHRDIKSDNIMVNSRNQVKVMDFGLAKLKGSMKLTRTSSTIGTLGYMAPEQIRGGEVDVRSDIFSFGIVLYEMLTGRLPFRGEHEAAMMYAILNEEADPLKVGSELNVRAVLTGRVVQRGENLNIQAELVDIQSQSQLWGEQYNRKIADLLSLQDEISRDIAAKLQLQLSGEEEKKLTRRPTENPEAYQLYLKGRFYWGKRSAGDIQKGIEFFQQAIDKDPTYALAYAGLADCYAVLPQYSGLPSKEIIPRAREAALKALKIDSALADAHNTLAFVHEELVSDFPAAEAEYKRAIELNPDSPTAHHWYSIMLAHQGRLKEAMGEAERAYQLDPLSLIINNLRAIVYFWSGDYDRAEELQRKTLELDSTIAIAHNSMGNIYLAKHMVPEALLEFEKAVRIS